MVNSFELFTPASRQSLAQNIERSRTAQNQSHIFRPSWLIATGSPQSLVPNVERSRGSSWARSAEMPCVDTASRDSRKDIEFDYNALGGI